ncbi:adenylate cyclase type 10-like isoform 1-T1 [Theristicus caerulescens]
MKPLPLCSSPTELQLASELLPISVSPPGAMPTILKSATNLEVPQCEAVLVSAGIELIFFLVAGFTALTEKFLQRSSADRGTDELAQTLNCYMSDILKEMLIFGGDVLKFAGDAVLVLWRTPPQELAKTISLVLQCSQQIQKKHGSRNTRVGLKLQLKIGISAGPMSLLIVGGGRRQYFCIYGQALAEVCEAEELAQAGEVILSATAWELCEQRRLRTQRLAGKRAVKVGGWDGL